LKNSERWKIRGDRSVKEVSRRSDKEKEELRRGERLDNL